LQIKNYQNKVEILLPSVLNYEQKDDFFDAIKVCLKRYSKNIIFNFENIKADPRSCTVEIDSLAIAMLIDAFKMIKKENGNLKFINVDPFYKEEFELIGLNEFIDIS